MFRVKNGERYTWSKWREGMKMKSVCNYILTGKGLKWKDYKVINVNFDTDHKFF